MCEIEENDVFGTTVWLGRHDSLDEVPLSHKHLITPEIRKAFKAPKLYFNRIAKRTPIPAMKLWLMALLDEDSWYLNLHQGDPKEWTAAGFCWYSKIVRSGEIAPPTGDAPSFGCAALKQYYSLVD